MRILLTMALLCVISIQDNYSQSSLSNIVACDSYQGDSVKRKKQCVSATDAQHAIEKLRKNFEFYPKSLECDECPPGESGCKEMIDTPGVYFQTMYLDDEDLGYENLQRWCFTNVVVAYEISCGPCFDSIPPDSIPPGTNPNDNDDKPGWMPGDELPSAIEPQIGDEVRFCDYPDYYQSRVPVTEDSVCYVIPPDQTPLEVVRGLHNDIGNNPAGMVCDTCPPGEEGCEMVIEIYSITYDSLSFRGTDSLGNHIWCFYNLVGRVLIGCTECKPDVIVPGDSSGHTRLAMVPLLEQEVKLFPNPADATLYLSYPEEYDLSSAQICRSDGSVVTSYEGTLERKLSIEKLLPGLYFLRLHFHARETVTLKFYKME